MDVKDNGLLFTVLGVVAVVGAKVVKERVGSLTTRVRPIQPSGGHMLICISDRYDRDGSTYTDVADFLAMCVEAFGAAPALHVRHDGWHDDVGLVLVEAGDRSHRGSRATLEERVADLQYDAEAFSAWNQSPRPSAARRSRERMMEEIKMGRRRLR